MSRCGCGAESYTGGWCFKCGKYRASKSPRTNDESDAVDHAKMTIGARLRGLRWPPNDWNA
jgi:hypothetical protein